MKFKYIFENIKTGKTHSIIYDLEMIELLDFQLETSKQYKIIDRLRSTGETDIHGVEMFEGDKVLYKSMYCSDYEDYIIGKIIWRRCGLIISELEENDRGGHYSHIIYDIMDGEAYEIEILKV